MTDEQTFDACMRIVETTVERRKNRQDYEWRFTIAFWTLIVLAIQFNVSNNTISQCWRVCLAVLVLLIYTCFWLVGIHRGHARDRDLGRKYQFKAEELLGTASPSKETWWGELFALWGLFFQVSVTALLLIGFAFIPQ
jgi:hypothetical protein